MKPIIDQAFWSDPDIEANKAGVKLAALWLITNSQTTLLGLCGASASRFEFETGLPAKALNNAVEALPRAFKRFGGVVFVRNYIRHQFGSGEKLMKNNFFIALRSQFVALKDPELKAFVLNEYSEFHHETPSHQRRASKPFEGVKDPKIREEKIREEGMQGEETRKRAPQPAPKPRPKARHTHPDIATKEDVLAFAAELGLPATDGEWFFSKNEGAGWMVAGRPIINWQETFRGWNITKIFPSHKQHEKTALADRRNGGNRNEGHNATVASGYGNRPQAPNGAA